MKYHVYTYQEGMRFSLMPSGMVNWTLPSFHLYGWKLKRMLKVEGLMDPRC